VYSKRLIIGARASALSQNQCKEVISHLKKYFPAYEFNLKTITTKGDKIKNALPKEKGIFVKEIETALINKEIDIAVHSLKDLPTELPPELVIGAVTKRKTACDVLITREGETILSLKKGAVIGTSSLRRKAQVASIRQDLKIVDIRGNVDTRVTKLREGKFDGIICALCALERLEMKDIRTQKLKIDSFLPAPGQGALAVEVRKNDRFAKELVSKINHDDTALCVKAERDFLNYLQGGCRVPVGAYASIKKDMICLKGLVAKPDGSVVIRVVEEVPLNKAKTLGKKLADQAITKGALKILTEL
jgi:hydroxymethylbilane synthase